MVPVGASAAPQARRGPADADSGRGLDRPAARVEPMEFTVENVCGLLIRSKLLTPDEVKAMYQRWQSEAKDAVANLPQFVRWLVSRQYVTEYQAALVAKGHADSFFINQYKILERLGRGRMAGVYKAVHHLGQVVAIKVLPPSKGKDPQQLARFQREVRLALKLKHPNVVRSFQIGHLGDLHYLVMEYLEGETLDVVLQRRRKLPPNEAVRLTYQALQGLQHLHEQGSLGCVLYHCLTGQPPFPDTNILTQMVRHATEPPRPLKELSPEVPDGLQQIVSRMLAKDPAQRYATPEQAAKALQAFQAAGAEPARLAEDGPQLRTFLTWVETDSNSQGREGASETDAAPKTPLPGKPGSARPAKLVLSPQPAALPVPAKKQHASKKHKRHKHQAAAPTPLAATPPAPSAPVHPSEFDVDLVPTVAPPAVPVPAKGGFRLSNRDWILLGVGAASVILAGVVGIVLANVLR